MKPGLRPGRRASHQKPSLKPCAIIEVGQNMQSVRSIAAQLFYQHSLASAVAGITSLALLAALTNADQWFGWILVGLTLMVPLASHEIRSEYRLLSTFYMVLASQQLMVIALTFMDFRPIDLWDATYFDSLASSFSYNDSSSLTWEVGYVFYVNILSLVYKLNDRLFVGAEFSVLLVTVSQVVIAHIAITMGIPRHRVWWVCLSGLIPASILFFSTPYREALQLLLLALAILGATKLIIERDRVWIVLLVPAIIFFGCLHKALMVYAGVFISLTMCWFVCIDYRRSTRMGAMVLVVTGSVFYAWNPVLSSAFEPLVALFNGDVVEQITFYRERMVDWGNPRTSYGIIYDWSTPVATLMTLTNIYLHYLFAPWFGIERWVDVYAVAESWMRIILLAGIAVNTPDILRERKGGVIVIFLLYLGLTALWAVGTTNYGQGIRHHVLTNWMLVMVAVASIPSLPKTADRR